MDASVSLEVILFDRIGINKFSSIDSQAVIRLEDEIAIRVDIKVILHIRSFIEDLASIIPYYVISLVVTVCLFGHLLQLTSGRHAVGQPIEARFPPSIRLAVVSVQGENRQPRH